MTKLAVVLASTVLAHAGQGSAQSIDLSAPDSHTYGADLTAINYSTWALTPVRGGEWNHGSGGWSWWSGGDNGTACANVTLPAGSMLAGITTYTYDGDPVGEIYSNLVSTNLANNTQTLHFDFATSGTPGLERIFRPLVPPLTINNDRRAHVLCISHGTPGNMLTSAGATLWYRLQVSPAPAAATFGDVPVGSAFHRFVEALAAAGITSGCGGGRYCPDDPLTRGQMAVFLSVALGLHFPN